jgi:hypothetical protein
VKVGVDVDPARHHEPARAVDDRLAIDEVERRPDRCDPAACADPHVRGSLAVDVDHGPPTQ